MSMVQADGLGSEAARKPRKAAYGVLTDLMFGRSEVGFRVVNTISEKTG